MIKEASIFGCGWLGVPLASELNKRGWGVKGSTTTPSKRPFLDSFLKASFLVDIDNLPENIGEFLSSDVLIISLPPKLNRRDKPFEFLEKLALFREEVRKSPLTKVLYISSTSVYGENQGKVDEDTAPKPNSVRGEVLLLAEEEVLSWSKKVTVLRFGGLVGKKRHPSFSLSGKKNLKNGKNPINLIHQEDCIEIILKIIEKDKWGMTFNGVAPFHPSKEDYYCEVCNYFSLPSPSYGESTCLSGKEVYGKLVEDILEHKFIYPNLGPSLFERK